MPLLDKGDQRGNQLGTQPAAPSHRIADGVIDPDVARSGAHPGGVVGVVIADVPLAPTERSISAGHHQRLGLLIAGNALAQIVEFLFHGRSGQVPPGYVRVVQPPLDQAQVIGVHPSQRQHLPILPYRSRLKPRGARADVDDTSPDNEINTAAGSDGIEMAQLRLDMMPK